jgi:hypothetical protein
MEWSCYSNAGTRRLVHYREVELATDPWTKTPIWLLSGVV